MKIYLALVFTAVVSLSAIAQKGLEIGLDVMPQTYWIMNSTDFDLGSTLDHKASFGVAYGVHVGLNFTNTMGLQTGFLYSAQGQKYKWTNGDYSQELTYIKVPLLLKFNGNPDNGAYFIGMIGPQLSLLTKIEQKGTFPNSVSFPTVKDAYKKADIGGVLSFGMGINLSDDLKLGIMLRFDGSLGDIENKDDSSWNFTPNRENSSNVTGGLMFSLNYIL